MAYITGRLRAIEQEHREKARFYGRELSALEAEVRRVRAIISAVKADRLDEGKPLKPLTPEQSRRRAESDRDRRQQMTDIQASASRRIAAIRHKLGR